MNFKKFIRNKKLAFTLAEVVVVMATLTVMMAAFAPVVTKKTITAGSSNNKILFDTMSGNNGVYFGSTSDDKAVIIGDNQVSGLNTNPKLLLVSNAYNPQIAFGYTNSSGGNAAYSSAQLLVSNNEIILGGNDGTTYAGYGTNNVIIGTGAGRPTSTATAQQTIVGADACQDITNVANVVCIGYNAGAGAATQANTIYLGNQNVGYGASDIRFGNNTLASFIPDVTNFATTTTTNNLSNRITALENGGTSSDIRLKNVGKEFTGGLEELNQLTFYNYTYKRDADKTPRVGVMAQDLQKVFPDAVSENKDGYLYIRKDDMFYAALNSIKELFKKMTDNSAKIKELEDRNAVLEKQVHELQELYIDLAKQVDKKAAKKKLTQTPEKAVEIEDSTPQEETVEQK